MYDNPVLYAQGNAKKEDLDRIEQKFHAKIPKEIREHWLAYNGGYPEKPILRTKTAMNTLWTCLFLYGTERNGLWKKRWNF